MDEFLCEPIGAVRGRAPGAPVFECRPIPHGRFVPDDASYITIDETDAVAWARANATRDLEQVTIEAGVIGDVSTFAVRHIKPDGSDSGWRCWRDGTFVGAISLDALFHRKPVVV